MESEGGVASTTQEKKPEVKLVEIAVTDENVALNLLVSFLNLAQRRGTFSIDESSKIWECVKIFQKK
jgi:hypothetical protein